MNSNRDMPSRRKVVSGLSLAALGMAIAGCAQKGPPLPRPQAMPLRRVAILPIFERQTTGDAFAFVSENTRRSDMPVVVSNPAGAAFAIGFNIASAGRRARFERSMKAVDFDPRAHFEKTIGAAFTAKGVSLERVSDSQLAISVRNNSPVPALAELDAVLDVQVTSGGYYPSDRAGGYSPMLYVVARLLSPATGQELERFGYDADYRAAEGELRFYTTSPAISVATPEEIGQKATLIRSSMQEVAERMIAQIVVDVDRRMRALPKVP